MSGVCPVSVNICKIKGFQGTKKRCDIKDLHCTVNPVLSGHSKIDETKVTFLNSHLDLGPQEIYENWFKDKW